MNGPKPTTLKVINGGIVDAVSPPPGLPKDAYGDWNTVTSTLAQRRLLDEVSLGPIENYVTALWVVRECRKSIEKEGLFVKGAGGALKSHPASTQMQKAMDVVTRLSAELGLTPSARSRKGMMPEDRPDEGPSVGAFVD